MKISKSKQELARIISESGGWRDGVEWATQDADGGVYDYSGNKPIRHNGIWVTRTEGKMLGWKIAHATPIKNWHQTILSRAEYFHLYPATDADGWIEWKGGECPVERGAIVDVKYANNIINYGVSALTNSAHEGHVCGTAGSMTATNWEAGLPMSGIIAYRLHKPEPAKSTAVGDDETNLAAKEELEAMEYRESPEQRAKLAKIYAPSIERLMQIHCDRAHALSEKKAELLVAERQELDALDALKAACKEAGFDIQPTENPQDKQEPDLVITDWRDLRVGDEVELVIKQGGLAMVGEVGVISHAFGNGDFNVDFPSHRGYSVDHCDIKFIRRP